MPGTVHFPFLSIVSTTSTIRGWALPTSSTYTAQGLCQVIAIGKRPKTHRQILERTGLLDVRQGRLELLQLNINFLFRLLGFLNLQQPNARNPTRASATRIQHPPHQRQ